MVAERLANGGGPAPTGVEGGALGSGPALVEKVREALGLQAKVAGEGVGKKVTPDEKYFRRVDKFEGEIEKYRA
eukprot:4021490-Karenia_brevis.AAC.1